MLPDFPEAKERLMEFWRDYAERRRMQHAGFLASIPTYRHYEGATWVMDKGGVESSDKTDYVQIQSALSISDDEIPNLTPEKIAQKLDLIAKDLANQMERGVFQKILKTHSLQNGFKSQPSLSKDAFLDALQSVEFGFDEHGKPDGLTVVLSPHVWNLIKDDINEWEKDKQFMERYNQILILKKEEWRARESCRKLVD